MNQPSQFVQPSQAKAEIVTAHVRNKTQRCFDHVARRAKFLGHVVLVCLIASIAWTFASTAVAAPGDLLRTFENPAPLAGDQFGASITAIGGNVMIGVTRRPRDRGDCSDDGSFDPDPRHGIAYLFDVQTGSAQQSFVNPEPSSIAACEAWESFVIDRFGNALAASDDRVFISAPWQLPTGAGGDIHEFGMETGDESSSFAQSSFSQVFVDSLALASDLLLAGASGDRSVAGTGGKAFLFDVTTGAELHTFRNSRVAFGLATAATVSHAFIGAPPLLEDSGRAFLFDAVSGDPLLELENPMREMLCEDQPVCHDDFGRSVAISGARLLVGDPGGDAEPAAFLFDAETGDLMQTYRIPNSQRTNFGTSVAFVGNNVLVGAPQDDTVGDRAGAAYYFDGSTGRLVHTFHNPNPLRTRFGTSVATLGNDVLVAAPGDPNDQGAVYLFQAIPEPYTGTLGLIALFVLTLRPTLRERRLIVR